MESKARTNLIGKRCRIIDNSFAFRVNQPHINPMLALTKRENSEDRPIVYIVSEPYLMEVDTIAGLETCEFITVLYKSSLCVVLNYIDLVD